MPMRPDWRLPLGNFVGKRAFPPGFVRNVGLGSARQCIAKARSTGKRCGRAAMQGTTLCPCHGGYRLAYRAERAKHPKAVMVASRADSAARKTLAAIAALDGKRPSESIIARGLAIETERNRKS